MIIQCPNCKTKFIVKDNLIPPEGKKVKCSQCGEIWHTNKGIEMSSAIGLWIFWILTILITSIIIYVGLIKIYGNKIPIPDQLINFLTDLGLSKEILNLFEDN